MYTFKGRDLYAGNLKVSEIAERYGTPLYIYDKDIIVRRVLMLEGFASGIKHLTCFAMKSNSNASIVSMLASYGLGVDVVSAGELYIALKAGVPPERIVFNGNGKRFDEIELAIDTGILMINVENIKELEMIHEIASEKKKCVSIALRWNPEIGVPTHPYIMTALKKSKFGLSKEEILEVVGKIKRMKYVEIKGIQAHIGSQILSVAPYKKLIDYLLRLAFKLSSVGVNIEYLDIGGGWGINYSSEKQFPLEELIDYLKVALPDECTVIFEPGRWIVADSGILVTKVLYKKERHSRRIIIVDAGMNDFMRPAIYGARHGIINLRKGDGVSKYDVVGPICESGDIFAEDVALYDVREGDYLAIMKTGAYGFSMASNYNMRPRPLEVMVDGKNTFIIRKRETIEDLLRRQVFKDAVLQDGR